MQRLKNAGVDVTKTYFENELAKGNEMIFAASGVTKGEMLDGVRFTATGAIVNSICTRLPSGTLERSETILKFRGHPIYSQIT
jgi:fructose-1,6-bisphosphatase II